MMDIIGLHDGRTLIVHPAKLCVGRCCIHNPSDHPLNTAPLDWLSHIRVMMRICPHGYSHPDVDDLMVRTYPILSEHWCDGCCGKPAVDYAWPATLSGGDQESGFA